jgi:hypothetical protein
VLKNHAIANISEDGTDSEQQVAHFLELTRFILRWAAFFDKNSAGCERHDGRQAQPNKMDYP